MLTNNYQSGVWSRSIGVKLILVCGLALLMTIPSFYVAALVHERTQRSAEVAREISAHVGGQQVFLGPTLAIPYRIVPKPAGSNVSAAISGAGNGVYVVFPAQASGSVKTSTEERKRSLFRVPVFQADLNLEATFDLDGVPNTPPPDAELDWSRAAIVVGVSDPRGALNDATLAIDGRQSVLVPAEFSLDSCWGVDPKNQRKLSLLSVPAGSLARPDARFIAKAALRFSGAQRIAVLAYGKTTNLTVQGDWQSPGFDGGFLPVRRSVAKDGFRAEWSIPFVARGVRAEGACSMTAGLEDAALGVSFIQIADTYQSVSRSLKYALLFVGLVFLSFFAFEISAGKRVHPAQYILVGIAQIIFYVLLLSIAERLGFDTAFLLAGSATVILLSVNARWVFDSRLQGIRALATFSLLYSLIYFLLRLEDNALLIGAIASFAAVAAVMYLTRGIDWYGTTLPPPPDMQAQKSE